MNPCPASNGGNCTCATTSCDLLWWIPDQKQDRQMCRSSLHMKKRVSPRSVDGSRKRSFPPHPATSFQFRFKFVWNTFISLSTLHWTVRKGWAVSASEDLKEAATNEHLENKNPTREKKPCTTWGTCNCHICEGNTFEVGSFSSPSLGLCWDNGVKVSWFRAIVKWQYQWKSLACLTEELQWLFHFHTLMRVGPYSY